MSVLKIYYPEETTTETPVTQTESQPTILPFRRALNRQPRFERQTDWVLNHARILFQNQQCPACNSSSVEKLELRDGLLNRRNRMIPGTSTVVGFRCECCDTEWPA